MANIGVPSLLGTKANTATATTIVVTITKGVAKGDHVIIGGGSATIGTTFTIADDRSNTYAVDRIENSTGRVAFIASAKVTTALLTNDNITVTLSATATDGTAAAYSVSGLVKTNWFDTSASAVGSSTNPSSGVTATRALPNELGFGMCKYANAGVSYAAVAFDSLLDDFNTGTSHHQATEYIIFTGTGNTAAAGTLNTTTNWTQLRATYKGDGAPNDDPAFWKKPVEQPLKSRVPKRQQSTARLVLPPSSTTTQTVTAKANLAGALTNVSAWREPISQPIRSRVLKRQQPPVRLALPPSQTSTQTITAKANILGGPMVFVRPGTVMVY